MSPERIDSRKRPNRLEEAITNPGAVKINVKGAFIVDDEPRSRSPVEAEGVHYENKDIRLPHHTGVVSHVAVDVSVQKKKKKTPAPHCDRLPRNPGGSRQRDHRENQRLTEG